MSIQQHRTKGPGWWQILYWPDGAKRVNGKIVTKCKTVVFQGTKAEAQILEKELRRRVEIPTTPISPSLSEAVPAFLEWYAMHRARLSVESWIMAWEKHLAPWFGGMKFHRLTPDLVEGYKGRRLTEGVKCRTINKELSNLSALWKWAHRKDWCNQPHFRIEGFEARKARAPLPVVPTAAEVRAIIEQMKGDARDLALMMYYGGLRKQEAFRLRAETVLLDAGIMLVVGKGNKERVVPIHPLLRPMLAEKIKARPGGFLWVNPRTARPYGAIRQALNGAAKRAGVSMHVYPHLLRHGFGTHSIEDGVHLRALQSMMGHASSHTTEIYTHLSAQMLKAEIEKLGFTQYQIEKPKKNKKINKKKS